MERIEEIKQRYNDFRQQSSESEDTPTKRTILKILSEPHADIAWLIAEVARLTKIVEQARDKSQILASNCAAQKDRGGNVQAAYAFEKSQQIYEILRDSISKE